MRKTMFILAAAVASLVLTQAFAQVPKLDIEKTCHAAQPLLGNDNTENTGNLGNSGSTNTYQTCMQSETAAKKSAADLWSKVSATDRQNCVGLSKMVYPSYVELLSCLQMYNPATSGITSPDQTVPHLGSQPNRRP
jgi:hypothetical protein